MKLSRRRRGFQFLSLEEKTLCDGKRARNNRKTGKGGLYFSIDFALEEGRYFSK